jgi:RND superfamily putative drug exporter
MFDFLGRFAAAHPWKILASWVAVAFGLTLIAPNWKAQSQDDDIRFLPSSYPCVRGYQLMERAFPKEVSASRAMVAIERNNAPLTSADFQVVDKMAARLRHLREENANTHIVSVASYRDGPVGDRLISRDKHCTLIQLALDTPYLAGGTREAVDLAQKEIQPIFADSATDGLQMWFTGPAGIGRDLVKASAESLDHTTLATLILVVMVLLAVYRSPLLALIPLITIGVAVWVSLQLLALATLIPGVHIVSVSQVFAIVILFGAGTDYCLFLISRYREELEFGQEPATGVARATRAVGGALAASAGTVICGLGMMGFAEFGKIRCAGPVIALGLAVGLVASLTLTPALLRLGKKMVFWPDRIRISLLPFRPGFWNRVSHFIVRRPGLVFTLSLVALVPLALLGTQIQAGFKPIGDLSTTAESVKGLDVIQRHFTAGETGPLTVLLSSPADWNSPEGKLIIDDLSRGLANLQNVAEVRSMTQPLGVAIPNKARPQPTTSNKLDFKNLLTRVQKNLDSAVDGVTRYAAEKHYTSKIPDTNDPVHVTKLDIVFHSDPFETASIETLSVVELWMNEVLPDEIEGFGSIQKELFGVTVHSRDMGRVVAKDRMLVNILVLAGVFSILLILVRRFWMAGYLLATVLLSYYATLGLTALFTMYLTGKPFGVIEWRVPFFLFTILVAIGEDYNILLVTRILQERKRHGLIEGTRRGLATTGGTITACGLIMAGTFATLMLADLSTLKQIGFALAVGVLLDTFLVRPLLVPAFLLLVWQEADPVAVRKRKLVQQEKLKAA